MSMLHVLDYLDCHVHAAYLELRNLKFRNIFAEFLREVLQEPQEGLYTQQEPAEDIYRSSNGTVIERSECLYRTSNSLI
jgi:hypothetical protein